MTINGKKTIKQLLVTGLGKLKVILGFPWLNEQNLVIDWKLGTVSFPENKKINWKQIIETKTPKSSLKEEEDEEEWKNRTINRLDENETSLLMATLTGQLDTDIWINAKTNLAMDMAIKANLKKKEVPVTELIPPEYHEFLDVFDEEKANIFPESHKWDHEIEMKEGFSISQSPTLSTRVWQTLADSGRLWQTLANVWWTLVDNHWTKLGWSLSTRVHLLGASGVRGIQDK